ncbi:hypothetical protein LCGC14_1092450 [marine sediment metagenome]|uniref:Uncharacterized protein n=1 Tax=marine sediment metagenome TaxID=412755 RepID=A0A0F9MGA6_9ZZZZ
MTESTYKTKVAFTNAVPCCPYSPASRAAGWSFRTVCVGDYESCVDVEKWYETEYNCQCAFVEPVNAAPSRTVFD